MNNENDFLSDAEQFEYLGRYVQAFELVLESVRFNIVFIISGSGDQSVANIILNQKYMTAEPLKDLYDELMLKVVNKISDSEEKDLSLQILRDIKTNEIVVCDYKSYGVVKRRYGKDNKSTLDKDKREKVRLQLSLYAYAMLDSNSSYRCSKVKLLYLHDDLVREYEMDIIPRSEIEKIINDYIKTTENYYITF